MARRAAAREEAAAGRGPRKVDRAAAKDPMRVADRANRTREDAWRHLADTERRDAST